MRRITTKIGTVLAAIAMLALTAAHPAEAKQASGTAERAASATVAYFEFDYPPDPGKVIFKLTDPALIRQARDILNGTQTEETHVMGRIIKRPVPYNPAWSYHLDPYSIRFFSMAIEVCDATPTYVEDHLDEVGGAFLPGGHWCPWGSRLLREVPGS